MKFFANHVNAEGDPNRDVHAVGASRHEYLPALRWLGEKKRQKHQAFPETLCVIGAYCNLALATQPVPESLSLRTGTAFVSPRHSTKDGQGNHSDCCQMLWVSLRLQDQGT